MNAYAYKLDKWSVKQALAHSIVVKIIAPNHIYVFSHVLLSSEFFLNPETIRGPVPHGPVVLQYGRNLVERLVQRKHSVSSGCY